MSSLTNSISKRLVALWKGKPPRKSVQSHAHRLEKHIIPTDPKIVGWLRYRDDFLYGRTSTDLERLLDKMNKIHQFLKFIAEISNTDVTYLDIGIFTLAFTHS